MNLSYRFRLENDGISFRPSMPENIGFLQLKELKFRGAKLNITVKGKGSKIKKFYVNGKKQSKARIDPSKTAENIIVIELE